MADDINLILRNQIAIMNWLLISHIFKGLPSDVLVLKNLSERVRETEETIKRMKDR
jgi:hypothetical protein